MALIDVDMTGVEAEQEYQELPVGQYLVRILNVDKKPSKDKFNTDGTPAPGNGKNFNLEFQFQVEGGPNHGHEQKEWLALWNINETAVRIAKSRLKSIQDATGVYSPDSTAFHGKFLLMNVKLDRNSKLARNFEAAPHSMYAHLTSISPQQHAPQHHQHAPAQHYAPPTAPVTQHHAAQTQVHGVQASGAVDPNAPPSWATKR